MLRAADGTKLHAWLLKQRIASNQSPTVLYLHGNAGNISHVRAAAVVVTLRDLEICARWARPVTG